VSHHIRVQRHPWVLEHWLCDRLLYHSSGTSHVCSFLRFHSILFRCLVFLPFSLLFAEHRALWELYPIWRVSQSSCKYTLGWLIPWVVSSREMVCWHQEKLSCHWLMIVHFGCKKLRWITKYALTERTFWKVFVRRTLVFFLVCCTASFCRTSASVCCWQNTNHSAQY